MEKGRKPLRILLIMLAVMPALLAGCARLDVTAVHTGLKENPYYQLGDTWWDHGGIEEYYYNQIPSSLNEIYRELYERIRNYEDAALLYSVVPTQDFWTAYYSVLADHPELFWVGADIEVEEAALTGKVVSYRLSVTVPKEERDSMKERLEQAADECIAGISGDFSDYQKIKYVYEYLINTVDYDENSDSNQNIQSALLGRASVCAGYSRAFQYILHRMGMFCTYVTGKTSGNGDHAWNIVRIGDEYYNVDVTWGDPVFAGASEGEVLRQLNYNYLCCTDEELLSTHVPLSEVDLPVCSDGSYNYYRLNGMYYESFDADAIYQALMDSVYNGRNTVIMKFASDDDYLKARQSLFSEGLVNDAAQYLMSQYGTQRWNYSYQTEDTFRLITIYWTE